MNEVATLRAELEREIVGDIKEKVRKVAKDAIIKCRKEMIKRDRWIERRQAEKQQLMEIENKIFDAAERGESGQILQLMKEVQGIASTANLSDYRRKYGKPVAETLDDEEFDDPFA